MKIYFPKKGINYKGEPQPAGTVLDVDNTQHSGALLAGGCKVYNPDVHKVKEPKRSPGRPPKDSK